MALEFSRVVSPVEDMDIWNANGNGFSFVISYESRSGPGFHGRTGFVASWVRSIKTGLRSGLAARLFKRELRPKKPARPCCESQLGLEEGEMKADDKTI
jgi:hypothetical protein